MHVQSAILSWFCRFPHRMNLPTRSFTTHPYLIFFCHFPYWQSLPIRLCERYSESQPIRSRIWLFFISCQLQVKLTGTLGWLSGAWRTLALRFQCVDFCVNRVWPTRDLPARILLELNIIWMEHSVKLVLLRHDAYRPKECWRDLPAMHNQMFRWSHQANRWSIRRRHRGQNKAGQRTRNRPRVNVHSTPRKQSSVQPRKMCFRGTTRNAFGFHCFPMRDLGEPR